MGSKEALRGSQAEEVLRLYFLRLGYFVLRGAKVRFMGSDVTDIDLWCYFRVSPLTRERTNVDAKFRAKAAKALERVLWARGLRDSLGFERAIVATTDNRDLVKKFGRQNDVSVLDGGFWSRLRKNSEIHGRLTEHEFDQSVLRSREEELLATWPARLEKSKSLLVSRLGFDACNWLLSEFGYFAEQVFAVKNRIAPGRLVYLHISYFLIALDFASHWFVTEEVAVRKQLLTAGFRHGSEGQARTEQALHLASELVALNTSEKRRVSSQLRLRIMDELEALPVDMLSEYFGKPAVLKRLFDLARDFESYAYEERFRAPDQLEIEHKAVLGLLLDFHSIDRARYFDALGPGFSRSLQSEPQSNVSE